ncbi:MAG: tryptophan synthase subunit alpha [Sphingomonadales bacterium]
MSLTTRYDAMFERLRARGEGAFGAFLMLGDPDLETSARLLRAAARGGADMLEVGIPFSDPIADGPVIQAAADRALKAGVTPGDCFALVGEFREEFPDIPVGILTYANIVIARGRGAFYGACAQVGLDSLLVADVPVFEAEPFVETSRNAGVAPVLIAAPNTPDEVLAKIARLGAGYTYCVARAGVTGADERLSLDHSRLLETLARLGAPPPILGFGISKPDHVRAAIAAGAAGVISGSAIVGRIAEHLHDPFAAEDAVETFLREMKAATRR